MKRRDILKNIGLGTAGVMVSGETIAQTKPKATPSKEIPEAENGRLRDEIIRDNKLKAEKFFTAHELATVTVLVDIIIPADAKSGSASQAGVPAFIEFIAKDMPYQQTPLRGGLMWLDNESKKQFSKKFVQLSASDRLKIVDLIAYPAKAKPEHSQGVSFFNLMRNLTATGFFSSEIGIKDLGYAGNTPNKWDGVPQEVLNQYNLSYTEWEKHLAK
ncbi:gluconate 2-dehydrogenase subunit 3 family protein [Lacihabitans sp. LS3-19]|uniref:gluconate 2-dehydrogenase subunit 3 family protein n=1 Tax=Lacihabitans sp. LS3-19 TaxID=2487335 RepID=UPI0020CC24FC|nr:gluconate 2-dehydrogenase subunit 3 family protein [Lacihabitans sp. LS3-19]MCP9769013.1 gluconate 2-dehydrogenase subunit 3 family protein [Lacihabitans sp. LS3-19]